MKSLKILFALVAVVFLASCTANKSTTGLHNMPGKENIRTPEMMTESFAVSGNCDMCKTRIEKAAKNVNGVTEAKWSVDNKSLTVMYFPQKTDNAAIQQAVAAVGHDTEKFKATKASYDKLPGCCRYDRTVSKN